MTNDIGATDGNAVDQTSSPVVTHYLTTDDQIPDPEGKRKDEMVKDFKSEELNQENVALLTKVKGETGMLIHGQILGSPITWKIDTGAKRTFITEESYYNIVDLCIAL